MIVVGLLIVAAAGYMAGMTALSLIVRKNGQLFTSRSVEARALGRKGAEYQCTVLSPNGTGAHLKRAPNAKKKYRPGQSVKIYYWGRLPRRYLLSDYSLKSAWGHLAFYLFALLLGIALLIFGIL